MTELLVGLDEAFTRGRKTVFFFWNSKIAVSQLKF